MALAAKAEAPVRPVRLSARHSSTPRKGIYPSISMPGRRTPPATAHEGHPADLASRFTGPPSRAS